MPNFRRDAQLKLLQNELILVHERAEKLGLDLIASLVAMAVNAFDAEMTSPRVNFKVLAPKGG